MNPLSKTQAALAAMTRPQSDRFVEWSRQYLDQAGPEFSGRFDGPEDPAFLNWIATHGRLQLPDLIAPYYPELPPAAIRETGCFGASDELFLSSGLRDVDLILTMQEVFAPRHLGEEGGTVLDFGSGAGRALRWLQRLPNVQCIGSDVLSHAVSWCAENLDGRYIVNDQRPPLDLADDSCDLIYALSIFSHFGRESGRAWITELARVCKPDGLIVLTTHGSFALGVLMKSEEHQTNWGIRGDRACEILRGFETEGFQFESYADEVYERWPEVERNEWGQAFLNERFVREAWSAEVELLGTVPAALGMIQDVHCLKPR